MVIVQSDSGGKTSVLGPDITGHREKKLVFNSE